MNEFYLIHTTFGYEGFVLGISDSEKSGFNPCFNLEIKNTDFSDCQELKNALLF